ncbi:MAG: nuclear transport factor 2 family protein [Alphaproteobacteria bacterium]|nr:nuclear transport factor 2 family protein [Alphaproteobacteria bacterium]
MPISQSEAEELGRKYTEAWCSHDADAVASFFAEKAISMINAGEPTVGRPAIAETMGAFFEDFPDLVLRMDDLRSGGNQAIYPWTLEGTNSGPGGTGNFVRIPGWQNWRLSDDLLIVHADGGYDAVEYERQIREGL